MGMMQVQIVHNTVNQADKLCAICVLFWTREGYSMSEFKGSQNYVASEELMRAVNIAMVLEKPLLIKGEPGTGKTMLAEAISQALGKS